MMTKKVKKRELSRLMGDRFITLEEFSKNLIIKLVISQLSAALLQSYGAVGEDNQV